MQQQVVRPEDDLEYQEYKLFRQQELARKQREERERMERMERELMLQEQQYVQPGGAAAAAANPYSNHDPNVESGNNTMGHPQSFGAGYARPNIGDPSNPHRSHYNHDHNVER